MFGVAVDFCCCCVAAALPTAFQHSLLQSHLSCFGAHFPFGRMLSVVRTFHFTIEFEATSCNNIKEGEKKIDSVTYRNGGAIANMTEMGPSIKKKATMY